LELGVDVKNAGSRDGDEVVQLYLEFPKLSGAPLRALRGFQRVHLRAGESRHVRFNLNARDLSMVNESGERLVAPGTYQLNVGGGQPGTNAESVGTSFTIRGEQKLPD